MFFGLTNSPATFQAIMNKHFKELIDKGTVVVYMDDILIFTKTLDKHRQVVRHVLEILSNNNLYLKPEKCLFEQSTIEFLGLLILHNHVGRDPVKVNGIATWPTPCHIKDVQSFVGFCNFYHRFIQDFLRIAKPLHTLTTKDQKWDRTPECQAAFDTLKARFTSLPILILPDPTKPYCIECNASNYATDAILSQQDNDDKWHPVAYLSKAMLPAKRNYNIYNKELLAIVHAFEAWRHYLEGSTHAIDVFSDHSNLTYFTTAQRLTRRPARWSIFLTCFDFWILHKPGRNNHANPLSQRADMKNDDPAHNNNCALLIQAPVHVNATPLISLNNVRRNICAKLDNDPIARLITTLLTSKATDKHRLHAWEQKDNTLTYHGRLYVPDDNNT
jgi:hypothetical protein